MTTWGRFGRWSIETAKAKFIAKTRPGKNGCVEWTGCLGSHRRYGSLAIAGKSWLAHRAAWFLFRGEDPGERTVCHHCDNGLCVNPDHLFIGTQADNIYDMEAKGRSRHPSCESHGRAKLTNQQVTTIREQLRAGLAVRALARDYGVSKTSISRIKNGTGWLTS